MQDPLRDLLEDDELLQGVDDPLRLPPLVLCRHLARHVLALRADVAALRAELHEGQGPQLLQAAPGPARRAATPRAAPPRALEVDPWPDRWRAVQQRLREALRAAGVRRGIAAGVTWEGESISGLWSLCEERQQDLLLSTLIRVGARFGEGQAHHLLTGQAGPALKAEVLPGKVAAARKARGWSQAELGGAARLSNKPIQRIETGGPVRVGTVCRVAAVLGVFPEALLIGGG